MKSIWNCQLVVNGLVIPVQCFAGSNKTGLKFVQVDTRDNSRIALFRKSRTSGAVVDPEFLGRAFEFNGSLLPVSDELYDSCLPPVTNQLILDHFVSFFIFPPCYVQNFYWCVPQSADEVENFSILHEILSSSGNVAISQTTFHNCSQLFAIMPFGNALVMMKLCFEENILEYPEIPLKPFVECNQSIADIVASFIDENCTDWDISGYKDSFDETFLEKIAA